MVASFLAAGALFLTAYYLLNLGSKTNLFHFLAPNSKSAPVGPSSATISSSTLEEASLPAVTSLLAAALRLGVMDPDRPEPDRLDRSTPVDAEPPLADDATEPPPSPPPSPPPLLLDFFDEEPEEDFDAGSFIFLWSAVNASSYRSLGMTPLTKSEAR
mmetsp:Transcript_26588/g.78637  ORF Transcript_26588/g.78637 Transcript_26588/m.78637 type:complete len:158 (-) Transcript_26588:560-1033(-)